MAVTNEKSAQLQQVDAALPDFLASDQSMARCRAFQFDFTQGAAAGDAESTALLCRLHPGKWTLLAYVSRIENSAFGAGRTLNVGVQAYTKSDGSAQAAQEDVLVDGLDVAAAGGNFMGSGTNGLARVDLPESRDRIEVYATVKGATIPSGATIKGVVLAISG